MPNVIGLFFIKIKIIMFTTNEQHFFGRIFATWGTPKKKEGAV
jgi:hypothetical protein